MASDIELVSRGGTLLSTVSWIDDIVNSCLRVAGTDYEEDTTTTAIQTETTGTESTKAPGQKAHLPGMDGRVTTHIQL